MAITHLVLSLLCVLILAVLILVALSLVILSLVLLGKKISCHENIQKKEMLKNNKMNGLESINKQLQKE